MARLADVLYFRKIFLLNVEVVPKLGPLLIVCNHPSSFFEPCILAVLMPRPLYFLTRGDFFKKRIFSWFLRQTHQIPIFRLQDGFEKLRNNTDTFAYCYQALSEHKSLLIFPESWTILEKRLRPMQKGAARLALGALKHIPDLNILPVGITFSNPTKFRSTVTVRCGKLIQVVNPKEISDERLAMAQLTTQIEAALRVLIVHIDRSEREPLYDSIQQLVFNSAGVPTSPVISAAVGFPSEELRLAEYINALSDDVTDALSAKITAYESALKQHQLTDRFFAGTNHWPEGARILLVLIVPLLILGKAIFALPGLLIPRFLNARIHKPPFYGPVKWAMGFYLFGVWILFLLILGYIIAGFTGFIVAFVWLMIGYFTLRHFHDIGTRGFLAPLMMSRESRQTLQELRNNIMKDL